MNLKQIKQLRKGITGPWRVKEVPSEIMVVKYETREEKQYWGMAGVSKTSPDIAAFIAAAPEIVDWLVEVIEDLLPEREHLRAIFDALEDMRLGSIGVGSGIMHNIAEWSRVAKATEKMAAHYHDQERIHKNQEPDDAS